MNADTRADTRPDTPPPSQAWYGLLQRYSSLRREWLNTVELRAALASTDLETAGADQIPAALTGLCEQMAWPTPDRIRTPDPAMLPLVLVSAEGRAGLVLSVNAESQWVTVWFESTGMPTAETLIDQFADGDTFYKLRIHQRFRPGKSQTLKWIGHELLLHKRMYWDIAAGSLLISLLALAASLYSMHVYNRVLPSNSLSTLWVLTAGVLLCLLFETGSKWMRGHQLHHLADAVDRRLARDLLQRFLSIRIDQLPTSVGSTSARLRTYESIRSFLLALTTHIMIDAPLGLIMVGVMAMIGGWLTLIPLAFLLVGSALGVYVKGRLEYWTQQGSPARYFKTGLLVETISGAETIKSTQAGWRVLSKWLDITDEARYYDRLMSQLSEHGQYLIAAAQQLSYIGLVGWGAYLVTQNQLSMGGLIACSILSGRVLAPITLIPNLLMQWSNAKMAIVDLDRLWALEQDHPNATDVLLPERLHGHYRLQQVKLSYQGLPALLVSQLDIKPGERIGIIGGIGSGKTSLLRLLTGLYKPNEGQVLLDGMALQHIARSRLAEQLAYVSQDACLLEGTLRDNLLLGLPDPGDEVLMTVARQTGLADTVIASHPKGLNRPIFEGGMGLSGGQRQLVHLTRAWLRKPSILLLDEPSAAMDQSLENRVIGLLQQWLLTHPKATLVLVTHKPQMLVLTERLIVMSNGQLQLDGPRQAVLDHLGQHAQRTRETTSGESKS